MGAAGLQFLHAGVCRTLQFQFTQGARRITGQDVGHQRDRQHRDNAADIVHDARRERGDCRPTRRLIERREVQGVLAGILAHGQRRAEVDAGIAEAVPAAADDQPQVAKEEAHADTEAAHSAYLRYLRS
jgi:hypothetical protein